MPAALAAFRTDGERPFLFAVGVAWLRGTDRGVWWSAVRAERRPGPAPFAMRLAGLGWDEVVGAPGADRAAARIAQHLDLGGGPVVVHSRLDAEALLGAEWAGVLARPRVLLVDGSGYVPALDALAERAGLERQPWWNGDHPGSAAELTLDVFLATRRNDGTA